MKTIRKLRRRKLDKLYDRILTKFIDKNSPIDTGMTMKIAMRVLIEKTNRLTGK